MEKPYALIVEDDPDVAELYSHLMRLLGFSPMIRGNGSEAHTWLLSNVPNLVILDLRLEGESSGMDLLDRIRDDDRLIDTSVVVISGFPRMTDGLREKADLVLLKPVDIRQLAGLIQRLQVGNPNLLPGVSDPFDTRMLDEEAFIERIGYNLARSRKHNRIFALIAIRLIRIFPDGEIPEEINTRLSFEVARRLRRRLRLVDLTTRSSDGMFIVMLFEIREPENAAEIAGRLTDVLSQPFAYDGLEIVHTTSAGVVISSPDIDDPLRYFAMARKTARESAQGETRVLFASSLEQE